MRKHISFFAADADQWEADGMSIPDEDSLVLAVWRWFRGREDKSNLSVTAKVLYSMLVKRLESSEELSILRSEVGKKGAAGRWQNNFANGKGNGKTDGKGIRGVKWPTATATANTTATTTASSTASASVKKSMGDTPMPPRVRWE